MKKITFLMPILIAFVLMVAACGGSGNTKDAGEDTVKKDTIDRSSESFSNPH